MIRPTSAIEERVVVTNISHHSMKVFHHVTQVTAVGVGQGGDKEQIGFPGVFSSVSDPGRAPHNRNSSRGISTRWGRRGRGAQLGDG
jgi:hypothetical protein